MKYLNFFSIFSFCLLWGHSFGNPIGGQVMNENGENSPPADIPAILLVELSDPQVEKFRLDMEMFEKEQKTNPSSEPASSPFGINNLFQRYLAYSKNVTLLLLSPFRIPQVLQPSLSLLPSLSLPKFPSLNIPNSVYPSFMFHPMFTTGGSKIPDIPVEDVDTSKFVLPVPAKVEAPTKPQVTEHNFVQDPLPLPNKQNAKKPEHNHPPAPERPSKVPVQVQATPIQAQVTPVQPPKAPVPVEKKPILLVTPIKDKENAEMVPVQVQVQQVQAPVPNKDQEKVPVEVEQIQPATAQVQNVFGKGEKVPTILIQHFNPVLIQHVPAPTPITFEDSKVVENTRVQIQNQKPAEPAAAATVPNKKVENDPIGPVSVEQEISPEKTPEQAEVEVDLKAEVVKSPVVDTDSVPEPESISDANANTSVEQNETPIAEDKPEPEPIKDESKTVEVESELIDPHFSHPNPEHSIGETVSLYTSTVATTVFKPNEPILPIVAAEPDPESLFFDANDGKVVEKKE